MKKLVTAIAGAACLLAASATIAAATTTTTTTTSNVQALAAAESRVVTLLDHYSNSPAWKSQYKAALAVQTGDIARTNAALFPTAKGASLTWTATGDMETPPFVVRGTFTLSWKITDSGGGCASDYTYIFVYPEGSNVNEENHSAWFSEDGCQQSSTQVNGISGAQFLYIQTDGATAVVTITGPVTP
jgi:hypothetical protein